MPNNPGQPDLRQYTPPAGSILRCRVMDAGMQGVSARTFDTGAEAVAWMSEHASAEGGTLHWVLTFAVTPPVWRYHNGAARRERHYRVSVVPASLRLPTGRPSVPATLPCPGVDDGGCTGTQDCWCDGLGFLWTEDFEDNDDTPPMPALLPEVDHAE